MARKEEPINHALAVPGPPSWGNGIDKNEEKKLQSVRRRGVRPDDGTGQGFPMVRNFRLRVP